jgi:flagellar basal body rod protein FlgF
LLAIDNKPILSTEGAPIQLPFIPHSVKEDVSITPEGTIKVFNRNTGAGTNGQARAVALQPAF